MLPQISIVELVRAVEQLLVGIRGFRQQPLVFQAVSVSQQVVILKRETRKKQGVWGRGGVWGRRWGGGGWG